MTNNINSSKMGFLGLHTTLDEHSFVGEMGFLGLIERVEGEFWLINRLFGKM